MSQVLDSADEGGQLGTEWPVEMDSVWFKEDDVQESDVEDHGKDDAEEDANGDVEGHGKDDTSDDEYVDARD